VLIYLQPKFGGINNAFFLSQMFKLGMLFLEGHLFFIAGMYFLFFCNFSKNWFFDQWNLT